MAVRPPEAFIKLCQRFHQDVGEDHPTLDALAAFGIRGLAGKDRETVAAFVEELLSGKIGGDELKAIWWSTPADVYFKDSEQLISFLKLMREKLRRS